MSQLTPKKYLSPHEETMLRGVLKKCKERDEVYFLILLETGARMTEALNIQPSDLNPRETSVYIHGIKGSRDREVSLSKALYARIEALSKNGPPFPFTASNADRLWRWIRPVAKKCHALRHTFAVNLLSHTKDLHIVNYALGHKNIQNTMIYLDVSRSKDLQRAIGEMNRNK